MVVSIKDLLDNVALNNGHANWDIAVHRLDYNGLHELYMKAIIQSTHRGFNKGWKERSRLVSYPKKKLDEVRVNEHRYLEEKLLSGKTILENQ